MRKNTLFWGIVVTVVGITLLANSIGVLPQGWLNFFWAGLLIFAGLWFLIGPRLFKPNREEETLELPLEGARRASIRFNHGAGRLSVRDGAGTGALLQGTFVGGVQPTVERLGDLAEVHLKADNLVIVPGLLNTEGFSWDVRLTREIPLELKFEMGANEAQVDLTHLKVADIKVETGASSLVMMLPEQAGMTRVKVECGAASVRLRVPEGVAAHIEVSSGLMGVNVDTSRFPKRDGFYESDSYATAANRVDIFVEGGAASIQIQ